MCVCVCGGERDCFATANAEGGDGSGPAQYTVADAALLLN